MPKKQINCVHDFIPDSLSRLQEAHWYIHRVEENYHNPEPFRYSVNAFIRALKEIILVLSNELQNEPGFQEWFNKQRKQLTADPLINLLFKKRDMIVHHRELDFHSTGFFGVSRFGKYKLGVALPIFPTESSDEAYYRYIDLCRDNEKLYKMLKPEEDQTPCIERSWRIKEFPDRDLLGLIVETWHSIASFVVNVLVWLGGEHQDLSLQCVHKLEVVQLKQFSREDFIEKVEAPS